VLAGATLLAMVVAVTVNLRRYRAIPCGCFGVRSVPISSATLVRLGLLLLAVVVVSACTAAGTPPLVLADTGANDLISLSGLAGFLVIAASWSQHVPQLRSLIRT
jgi:methylamine utilization protein MauE